MQAIILEKPGNSKSLKIKTIEDPKKFRKDDVLIRHTTIGVNFFDVAFRSGAFKLPKYPQILGHEACGVIEAVGSGVTEFKVGERVAYATAPIGTYCEKRIVHKSHLILVPDAISDEMAAASLYKGLAAHTFLLRATIAKRHKRILVHGASGGVGQFLCQWARAMGLEVIGVVGSQNKVSSAINNGCKHVINREKSNFAEEVLQVTDGQGVGIVFDGVGKDTLLDSLKCIWKTGICVSFGEASGKVPNFDVDLLGMNSLFLTRPAMITYKSNRVELALAALEVFDLIKKKILKPQITTFNFNEVQKAHELLESRQSMGSIVLRV